MDVFLFSLDENLLDAFAQRHHHAFSLCFFASLDVEERREEWDAKDWKFFFLANLLPSLSPIRCVSFITSLLLQARGNYCIYTKRQQQLVENCYPDSFYHSQNILQRFIINAYGKYNIYIAVKSKIFSDWQDKCVKEQTNIKQIRKVSFCFLLSCRHWFTRGEQHKMNHPILAQVNNQEFVI